MVALPIGRQLFLTKEHEGVFVPSSGAWGRSGYTMVHLPKARLPIVKQALADAVEHIASKTKNKTKKKSAKTSAAQTQASASVNQVARQKK